MVRPSSAILACVLILAGCATHSKTYTAPDSARVNASSRQLSDAVDRATEKVAAAQKSVDALSASSGGLVKSVDDLALSVPPHLRDSVAEIKRAVEQQQTDEGEIVTQINAAWKFLGDASAARTQLEANQADYQEKAGSLANTATAERDARIKLEKKLSWYRWHWWGSWIALGSGILAMGAFAFLKFTGRLTLAGAQIAAKAGI